MARRLTRFLGLCLIAAGARAEIQVYVSTQDLLERPGRGNLIGVINLETGEATETKPVVDRDGVVLQMFDIAVNRAGEIYGVDSTQALWRIDARTGVCTRLAARLYGAPSNITGMTFHPETDELYLAGNEVSVYRLNIKTCDGVQCAPVVDMSKPPYPSNTCAGDLEFHKGELFFAGEFGILYRLKQDADGLWYSDAASDVLTLPFATAFVLKAMVSDGETLWLAGDTNQAPAPHYLTVVDPVKLTISQPVAVSGTGTTLISGLATKPIASNRPAPTDATNRRGPARPAPSPPPALVD